MATNPQREGSQRSGWPGKGKIMTEDAYHELERLSPDRTYEYIDGIAYMISGGSVAHDRINRNIGNALDRQLGSGSCFSLTFVQSDLFLSTRGLLGKRYLKNRKMVNVMQEQQIWHATPERLRLSTDPAVFSL